MGFDDNAFAFEDFDDFPWDIRIHFNRSCSFSNTHISSDVRDELNGAGCCRLTLRLEKSPHPLGDGNNIATIDLVTYLDG